MFKEGQTPSNSTGTLGQWWEDEVRAALGELEEESVRGEWH